MTEDAIEQIEMTKKTRSKRSEPVETAPSNPVGRAHPRVRVTRTAAPLPDGGDLEGVATGPGTHAGTTRVRITYEADVLSKYVREA